MKKEVGKEKSVAKKARNSPLISKLVSLIRSLTPVQKGDFKKYVKFWGGERVQKYILLFDAVNEFISNDRDLDALMQHLLEQKKMGTKPGDLTHPASYLYSKILESMRSTPDEAPHLTRLNALMQDIVFLHSKNLFEDCLSLIEEAMQLAKTLDKPAYQLELLWWKGQLFGWKIGGEGVVGFAEWKQEQDIVLRHLADVTHLNAIATETQIFLRKRTPLPEALDEQFTQILEKHEQGQLDPMPPRARLRALNFLSDAFDLKHTHNKSTSGGLVKKAMLERAVRIQGEAIQLFREHKAFAEQEQTLFSITVSNYINRCFRLGRFDLVEQLEAEMEGTRNELAKYQHLAYHHLLHYLAANEFEKARGYVEENHIAEGVEKHKHRMQENRYMALCFSIGQVCYVLDDFDRASDWFGKAAQMRTDIRPDLSVLCKTLELICLWEYGAFTRYVDLGSPVKNLRRSLHKARLDDDFVKKILVAVENVFRNPRSIHKDSFPKMMSDIKADMEKDQSKYLYALVFAWLEAKLNQTPVSMEILKFDHK